MLSYYAWSVAQDKRDSNRVQAVQGYSVGSYVAKCS